MEPIVRVDNKSRLAWTVGAFLLVSAIGAVDYSTGAEISFTLLYLVPVATTAWFSGQRAGVAIAAFTAATWLVADYSSGGFHGNIAVYAVGRSRSALALSRAPGPVPPLTR
jgi:hypothetical protein